MKNRTLTQWPVALAVVMALWALTSLLPRKQAGFQVAEFGRLPVLLNGRVQPFDSVARNALLQLRGKQTAPVKLHFSIWSERRRGKTMPAMEWLLELMFHPEVADTRKVFRIDHPEVISLLKLPDADPDAGEDGKHFSYAQLESGLESIEAQARRAGEKEAAQRTPFERQILKLSSGVILYRRLKNSIAPESVHDMEAEVEAYRKSIAPGLAAVHAREAGQPFKQEDFDHLIEHLHRFEMVSRIAYPHVIPPANPAESRDAWENMGVALMEGARQGDVRPAVRHYAAMATAFHTGRIEPFNTALAEYGRWLAGDFRKEQGKVRAETLFNTVQPFYRALVIHVFGFLLICFYWFKMSEPLRRAGWWLAMVALVIHTSGLFYRMVLEGRPPVTNLYSSAIFIGWGAAILGLLLERFHRTGLGIATASGVGFTTLVIAHNLSLGGDTMEMMRAVLDSNFWLATHVVAITIGYSATYVAGFLGMLYILRGVLTRSITGEGAKATGNLIYGITCFATLFSFVGTILGGIWADQSWGRFWGWDPKENGALIIVLWCAVMLHARWGKLVRERGLAAMAVFGNIVTSFSWFGVNMLGVGLHSYGFTDSGFKWLLLFVASQLAIIGLALLPQEYWASFRIPHPARRAAT